MTSSLVNFFFVDFIDWLLPGMCNNGDIRLVGGNTQYEGRVEVCWNEVWGTVCHDYWSTQDGIVACRQLGFSTTGWIFTLSTLVLSSTKRVVYYHFAGVSVFYYAYFGQGTGPIFLDNLLCNSRETRLIDCPHSGIGNHNCAHYRDASLRCQRKVYYVYLCHLQR